MRNGRDAQLLGVRDQGQGLKDPLGAYREGVGVVFQHIAKDQVAQAALVVGLDLVEHLEALGPQLVGPLLDGGHLIGRKAAGIHDGGVHVVAFFLAEVLDTKGSVEAAAVGEENAWHGGEES